MSSDKDRAIWYVGSMCHCDDPDECEDHWELVLVTPEVAAEADEDCGMVGRAFVPTKADLDALVAKANG